jgi:DNA-directed RNA polymerase specialized sigma24 family protein
MDEPGDAPDQAKRLRRLDWRRLLPRLVVKAMRLNARPDQVHDLAQTTALHVLAGKGGEWDEDFDPTGWRFLLRVMDGRLKQWNAQAELRASLMDVTPDTDAVEATGPESPRDPESLAIKAERTREQIRRLKESLAEAPLALRMVEVSLEAGRLKPESMAERLGVAVEDVYTAEALLKRHVTRILAEGEARVRVVKASP